MWLYSCELGSTMCSRWTGQCIGRCTSDLVCTVPELVNKFSAKGNSTCNVAFLHCALSLLHHFLVQAGRSGLMTTLQTHASRQIRRGRTLGTYFSTTTGSSDKESEHNETNESEKLIDASNTVEAATDVSNIVSIDRSSLPSPIVSIPGSDSNKTPLSEAITSLIQLRGPITVAEYMSMCLGHPRWHSLLELLFRDHSHVPGSFHIRRPMLKFVCALCQRRRWYAFSRSIWYDDNALSWKWPPTACLELLSHSFDGMFERERVDDSTRRLANIRSCSVSSPQRTCVFVNAAE